MLYLTYTHMMERNTVVEMRAMEVNSYVVPLPGEQAEPRTREEKRTET